MRIPRDLWNIILKYKTDMELLEQCPQPETNTVMLCDFNYPIDCTFDSSTFMLNRYTELLFGDDSDAALAQHIRDYVHLPLMMLTEYIKALTNYKQRERVWGLSNTGDVPTNWGTTTAKIIHDYCQNQDRELYTLRLAKLLGNSNTRRFNI
jgi:hypothetical protein